MQNLGPFRGLNPGPPAPKAGIIPLDQMDVPFNGVQLIYDLIDKLYTEKSFQNSLLFTSHFLVSLVKNHGGLK